MVVPPRPLYIRGQSRARAILLCNWDSISKIPEKWANKSHLFPVSGISSEDLGLASFDQTTGDQTNGHSKEQVSEPAQRGQFQVLTAGSLIRIKGFGLAIKAFKEFSDQYPESTFTIVGDGPERPHLLALIQRLDLEERVRLLPAIPRGELLQKMASSDVILFPSMRDGGGTVVIEAMSVGKPVVCLDIGGPGMHITEECGIKITPSSPEATVHDLAGALARLYLDPILRTRLGKAAHNRATQAYHWDRLGERLLEIYNNETTVSNRV